MMSLPLRIVATTAVPLLLAAPDPAQAKSQGACRCRLHVTYAHAWYRSALRRPRVYVPVPSIPRYDPAEVEAEVHEIARYRTPYPYPALFGPF